MWGEKQESLGSGRWAYGHIVKPYSYFLVKKAVPRKDMLRRICFHTPKSAFCSGLCAEHAITMCCHMYWTSWARMSALMAAFGTHSWRQTSLLGGCGQIRVVGFSLPIIGKIDASTDLCPCSNGSIRSRSGSIVRNLQSTSGLTPRECRSVRYSHKQILTRDK
jgi:hypothetical protein